MEAVELLDYLKQKAGTEIKDTVDEIKVGDPYREVSRVAVCMLGTVDVFREAMKWGADTMIVHEPLFYDHRDLLPTSSFSDRKREFVKKTGITVFRFHDYAHAMEPDLICEGEILASGLKGKFFKTDRFAVTGFELNEPMTAKELAEHLEKTLNICSIRVSGCLDKKGSHIACAFGAPGSVCELIDEFDYILLGETSEWKDLETVRDAAALGFNKAILVMGHETSEREGMRLLTKRLISELPGIEFRYFESESVVAIQ